MKNKLLFTIAVLLCGVLSAQQDDYKRMIQNYISENSSTGFKKADLTDFKTYGIDPSQLLNGWSLQYSKNAGSVGLKNITNDQIEDFSIPAECETSLATPKISVEPGNIRVFQPCPKYTLC
ncbi:hypothetical protein F3J23_14590 [Chryseobacterium sp. Tr-659]|uniref:hypothetical protein n=1 Tax=Chryseobacterium sp. Tr-659 TaxID=2608340 RepID=UPI00141EC322|nr:hypothetical protein [Chryseobacterium sp. Tr-659]NIF06675.1 hypothetical protein [Chryseobacterium sp. Tr-659]